MHPERWQNCIAIFQAAVECPPEERSGFLEQSCDGDDSLRRKVELLLKYHEKTGDFIERPAFQISPELLLDNPYALIGQQLGRYRIDALLGAGGMGIVYLACDEQLGRKVGLKLLPQSLVADEAELERLTREARTASALNHPNIVTIHEIGQVDATHYIATEFIEGTTLRERMLQGPIPPNEALEIAIQIASALSIAHEAGIVHRDIKPENIMLRPDGYVKVLDFGIAKFTRQETSLEGGTRPGMILGTPRYVSPEQARSQAVDARTDVWSLGVVLYEMLAGRPPFEGATPADVVIAIVEREPVTLASHAPKVPILLGRIVQKALAKDREGRYQTATDLLIDLKEAKPEVEVERGPARNRTLIFTTLAGMLIVAGLVFALFLRQSSNPVPPTEIKALAVLPLENLSSDNSQDFFSDEITESLITDLSKIGALRVISRSAVMRYKGTHKPLPEIGRELKVDAVLTGSVMRSSQRVRIAVQLIHAATQRNLWAESYERDLRDVLALQSEVTRDIAGVIRIKLTPQEQRQFGSVRPVNPEAYDRYLRGRFHLNRQTKEDNEAAIAALERAVAADPAFAAAHAELAQAYVWKLFLFAPKEKQWAEKAFVAVEKALALDPNAAGAYLARGRLLWTPGNHFPHEKAIREYQRALTLNPNLDEARNQLALVYCHIGAFDEALEESQKAIATNPNNNLAQFRIGQTLNFQGKYEEALSVLRALPQEVNPALVGHQSAWALYNLGRKEEASALLEQLLRDYPEDSGGLFTSIQAVLAASAGQERLAEEKIKLAVEKGKGFGHFHHTAYHIACAYALLNKTDLAVEWFERTVNDGFNCYPMFQTDSNLDHLRNDPRFQKVLEAERIKWENYGLKSGTPTRLPDKSIAVLPLENLSAEKEDAFFAAGVHEELLSHLAKVRELKVISRTSVMQYKSGRPGSLKEIARQLGVNHVVEGSVRRSGDQVRVSVQLIDARTDTHLWAEHYDRDVADIFAVQAEMAQQIANQLRAELSASEKSAIAEPPTADLVAYAFYAKARETDDADDWEGMEKSLNRKVALLEKATERDPTFGLAYCALAKAQCDLFSVTGAADRSHLESARKAAEAALRVRPDLGEAHLELARYYYYAGLQSGDFDRGRDELIIARRKLPNDSEVLLMEARIEKRQNLWDASLADLQWAGELDPRNVYVAYHLWRTYLEMRRYHELEQFVTRSAATGAPGDPWIQTMRAEIKLAQGDPVAAQSLLEQVPLEYSPIQAVWETRLKAALYLRDYDAADRLLEVIPAKWAEFILGGQHPKSWVDGQIARVRGDEQKAHLIFAAARELLSAQWETKAKDSFFFSNLARLDAGLGQKEDAIREGLRAVDLMPMARDSYAARTVAADLALVYAWIGERDRAFEQLEMIADVPAGPSYGDLLLNPCWDDLRGDKRFEEIIAAARAASR